MKKTNPQPQIIQIESDLISIDSKDVKKYLSKLKTKKPRIIFFGSDSFVLSVFKKIEENFDLVAVVTSKGSAVSKECTNIPCLTPDKLDDEFLKQIESFKPDLFIVASYGKILPQSLLGIPKFGALNIHPSLLPKLRGPSPVPSTILNGEKETGVTIIKMDQLMDHGPMLYQDKISLSGKEDLQELINKLFQIGGDVLIELIPEFIAGKIKLKEQDHTKATFTKFIKKEDGYFNIDNPPSPEILDRKIRAYYPWPTAWTKWNNKIIKFLPADLIQMEGKKPIPLKDFLNGYPDFPLKQLLGV